MLGLLYLYRLLPLFVCTVCGESGHNAHADCVDAAGTSTPLRRDSDSEEDVPRACARRMKRRLFSSSDEESEFEDTGVEAAHTHLEEDEEDDE